MKPKENSTHFIRQCLCQPCREAGELMGARACPHSTTILSLSCLLAWKWASSWLSSGAMLQVRNRLYSQKVPLPGI